MRSTALRVAGPVVIIGLGGALFVRALGGPAIVSLLFLAAGAFALLGVVLLRVVPDADAFEGATSVADKRSGRIDKRARLLIEAIALIGLAVFAGLIRMPPAVFAFIVALGVAAVIAVEYRAARSARRIGEIPRATYLTVATSTSRGRPPCGGSYSAAMSQPRYISASTASVTNAVASWAFANV
jgi:hypothetical protein